MVSLTEQIEQQRQSQIDAEKKASELRGQIAQKLKPYEERLKQAEGKRRAVAQARLDRERARLREEIEALERKAKQAQEKKNELRGQIGKGPESPRARARQKELTGGPLINISLSIPFNVNEATMGGYLDTSSGYKEERVLKSSKEKINNRNIVRGELTNTEDKTYKKLTPENYKKNLDIQTEKFKEKQEQLYNENKVFSRVASVPVGFGLGVGSGIIKGGINIVTNPVETFKEAVEGYGQFAQGTKVLVSTPFSSTARTQFREFGGEIGPKLQSPLSGVGVGEVIGESILYGGVQAGVVRASIGTTKKVTGEVRRFVSPKFEPTELVINPKKTDPQFPRATSTEQTIDRLKGADYEVITISPQKLGKIDPETYKPTINPIKGERIAGDTRKGALGLEDGGLNVAPVGYGNVYFARSSYGDTQITLNPITALKSYKDLISKRPTATRIETQGFSNIPQSVLNKPGFQAVREYQLSVSGSGVVLPTKRGILGQGELKRQKFYNPITGKTTIEKGTTEIELTIPRGTEITKPKFIGTTKTDKDLFYIYSSKTVGPEDVNILSSKVDDLKLKLSSKIDDLSTNSYKSDTRYINPNFSLSLGSSPKLNSSVSNSLNNYNLRENNISSVGSSGTEFLSFGGVSPPQTNIVNNVGNSDYSFYNDDSLILGGGGKSGPLPPTIPETPTQITGGGTTQDPPTKPSSIIPPLKEKKNKNKGVNVFVKERDKYIKVNKKPLPLNEAVLLGRKYVDNTTSQAYEIRGEGIQNAKIPESKKFYGKKTKNTLFFKERQAYKIDTLGEKTGLKVARALKDGRFNL